MKAALAVACTGVALLATACGSTPAPSPSPPRPTHGHDLILRTRTVGGIAGIGGPGSRPEFSLYADGRAIAGRTPTEYHLTRQALRRLVAEAEQAGLATPRTVDDPQVADAMYTLITYVTGGRPRTSKIIQLGTRPDRAIAFLRRLDPTTWPRSDMTADPAPYRPERVAVLAAATTGTGRRWPLPSLSARIRAGSGGCAVYEGGDAATAIRMITPGSLWRDHGHTYRVTARPLLPDEPDCAALTR